MKAIKIKKEDLKSFVEFKKIITNYEKMKNIINTSIFLLILAVLASCKTSKQTINEKIVKVSDSTAITELKKELSERDKKIISLTEKINTLTSDNQKLSENYEFYKNIYDTSKPIDPHTGKPPIKEEQGGKKWSVLEREIKTNQEVIKNLQSDFESQKQENTELKQQVKTLEKVNAELKSKTTEKQNAGFAWRVLLFGIVVGAFGWFLLSNIIKALIAKFKLKLFS